jgi:type 1 glutamine amidotransferase
VDERHCRRFSLILINNLILANTRIGKGASMSHVIATRMWHFALFFFGLASLTVCASSWSEVLAAESKQETASKKILLIGHQPDHPPLTHMYLPECEILAKCLRQSPHVEAIVSDGWPKDAALLQDVDAIVLYSSPGADLLLKGDHAATVTKMLDEGVGLVALHWATGVHGQEESELGENYLKQLGGLFCFAFSGLDISESKVEQLQPAHPVCRGWKDFTLTDEFYLDLKFVPQAVPLFKVNVKGKDHTVGWAYERPDSGGGRSYGNVLGHFHELFKQEAFRRMFVNGILWAAHCDIPENGAPCKVSEADLQVKS